MKIIFLHSNDTSISLDDLTIPKYSLKKITTALTVQAFLKLDKVSGLSLLRRLRSLGCVDLDTFTDAESEYVKNLDSAILISILEKGEAGALERSIGESDLIELFHRFVMINISPPPEIDALNRKLENDLKFSDSIEAKHWLSLYGHKDSLCSYQGFEFASLPNVPPLDDFSPTLQGYVFEQVKALLYIDLIPYGFDNVIDKISIGVCPDAEELKDWQEKEKPIIDRIIKLLDNLRTPEWQRDRDRKPANLPLTLKYRLSSVPYALESEATDAKLEKMVDIWKEFIVEIAKSGLPYHDHLKTVTEEVKSCLRIELEHWVACIFGRIHDNMTLPDFLAIQVAANLFERAGRNYVWDDENDCWEDDDYEQGGNLRIWRWRKNSLETGRKVVKTINNCKCRLSFPSHPLILPNQNKSL